MSHRYKAQDTPARKTFEQALTGAFMSAVIKDLRPSALPFVASLIRHYTMVAVAQQCGEWGRSGASSSSGSLKNLVGGGVSEKPSLADWFLAFVSSFSTKSFDRDSWCFSDGCCRHLKIVA